MDRASRLEGERAVNAASTADDQPERSPSRRAQGLRQAQQVLWHDANDAPARTVDVGDEEKGDGHH